MEIIQVRNLVKEYGPKRAVDGVSLSVQSGEFFGLLGPNGAGKTTAMRTLYCFTPPTSGEVRVMGLDVNESPSEIKSHLGVMPQEDNLDPDLSAIENLVVYARFFHIPAAVSRPRGMGLLDFLGLADAANVNVQKLSGGMKRRLTLARALINDPGILILDEPTTGMDPGGRRSVWGALEELSAKGTTIVLTTHYMEEAERLCGRVAIISGGRIIETGSPENLMRRHGCGDLEGVYLKLTGHRLSWEDSDEL